MEEQVNLVLNGPEAAATEATASVLAALKNRTLHVLGLVGLLQRPLTDDVDHEGRAKAVQLLAKVADDAPEALLVGDVAVMADFLAANLKDWRCITAAAPGCLALMQRHMQPALAQLPHPAAVALVQTFADVHVQALDYKGRIACYQLLLEVLQGPYGAAAALACVDLVSFTVVAMENESDPRCLLHCLKCVKAVGTLYNDPKLSHISHLHDGLEDLFDVGVVPYFPVVFKPPKNDPNAITREQLLFEVVAAMGCCPQFAALGVPLLSEKMGSALSQAKADSLLALPFCCKAWGAPAVRPHLTAVWLMLKAELMAPAAAEGLLGDQAAAKQATAVAAAAAVTDTVKALGPGLLDTQILNDVAIEDLQQYLGLFNPPWAQHGSSSGSSEGAAAAAAAAWDLPAKAQQRLACIARIVAAVAAAGGTSCTAVCSTIVQPAVQAVLDDTAHITAAAAVQLGSSSGSSKSCKRPVQANCGVLCLLHNVLQAVTAAAAVSKDAVANSSSSSSEYAAIWDLVSNIANVLIKLQQVVYDQQQQQQQDDDSSPAAAAVDAMQVQQLQLWLLLLWQDLMSLPSDLTTNLQQQQQQHVVDAAAVHLVQIALHGSSIEINLTMAPSSSSSSTTTHAAAAAALTKMASWPAAAADMYSSTAAGAGMQALQKHAAPLLLQLLEQHGSNSSSDADVLYSRALGLIQQIAGSSSSAAGQVMLWLQPLVLKNVQGQHWAALNTILPVLHSYCLPALPDSLAYAESAAAAAFCNGLLLTWQQQCGSSSSEVYSEAMLNSCIMLGNLAAKCSLQDQQQQLILTACEWITTAAAAEQQQQVQSSGPVCLAAAVVAAARPGLLTAASVLDLAAALAVLCTAGGSRSSSVHDLDSMVSGIALGSLAHKICAYSVQQQVSSTSSVVTADAILAVVLPVLLSHIQQYTEQQQYSDTENAPVAAAVQSVLGAVHCTAWLARGLAMQRHDGWMQCMQAVLLLLPAAAAEQQQLWVAAQSFTILIAPPNPQTAQSNNQNGRAGSTTSGSSSSTASIGLHLSLHFAPRPLWQQKAFTLALQSLSDAIRKQQQAALAAAGQQRQGLGLWLATAHLLSASPNAVAATAREQVVPMLLQCLVKLTAWWPDVSSSSSSAQQQQLLQLLHSCLMMVADLLLAAADASTSPAAALLEPHIDKLLDAICNLARITPGGYATAAAVASICSRVPVSTKIGAANVTDAAAVRKQLAATAASVREVALMCLTSVMVVPYHMLHPYRKQVVAVITAALDDDRRAVRKAAVVARASWTGAVPA